MDLLELRETDQLLLDSRTGEPRHLSAAQTGPDGDGARLIMGSMSSRGAKEPTAAQRDAAPFAACSQQATRSPAVAVPVTDQALPDPGDPCAGRSRDDGPGDGVANFRMAGEASRFLCC